MPRARTTMTKTHHNTVTNLFDLTLSQRTIFSENIANSKPMKVRFAVDTMLFFNVVQVTSLPKSMGSIGAAGPHIQNETENSRMRNRMAYKHIP